jgi:acyl carrier protein
MSEQIKLQVYKLIAETLNVSIDIINDELAVGDIAEWDSLGHMQIITALETKMGIALDIEQTLEIEDVEDILDAVKNNG